MTQAEDLVGVRKGRYTALSVWGYNGRDKYFLKCICDCGEIRKVYGPNFFARDAQSCGCMKLEMLIERSSTHKQTKSRAYISWLHMRKRCYDASIKEYSRYGARGITVCDRWNNSFENFFKDMGERPKGYTIERIDNDGNYEPGNCRWANRKEQARNTSRNIFVSFNEKRMVLIDCCKELGIPMNVITNKKKTEGISYQETVDGFKNGIFKYYSADVYGRGYNSPETREKNSKSAKIQWEDQERRKSASEQITGGKNPMAVLNEEKVRKILILLKDGIKLKDIAEMFGVSDGSIRNIKKGISWKNIER